MLEELGDRKVCEGRDLEGLIEILNHVCKVVRCSQKDAGPPEGLTKATAPHWPE